MSSVNGDDVIAAGAGTPRVAGAPDTGIYTAMTRRTLGEGIAFQLLSLIREEELRPGDQLPSERELAALLGVSRPVVREALRALSVMRVVEIRQGAGTFVTSLEPEQLISHLDFVFPRDGVALLKSLEARRVVEVANARFAAQRVSDAQISRLAELIGELAGAADDEDAFRALDIEFHATVCEAADNFLLMQFMKIADTLGEVSRRKTGSSRAVRLDLLRSLKALAEAIADRDPDAAQAAMTEHLNHVEARLRAADA